MFHFYFCNVGFCYKEVLQWSDSMEAKETPPFKPKTHIQYSTSVEVEELQDFEIVQLGGENSDCNLYVDHKVQGQQRRIKKMQSSKNVFCVLK